jgi:hypothetical protein
MTKFVLGYSLALDGLTRPLTLEAQDRSDIETLESAQKIGERYEEEKFAQACADEAAKIRRGAYHRAYPNIVEVVDDVERWKVWGKYLPQSWSVPLDVSDDQAFEMPVELKEKMPTYRAMFAKLEIRTRYYNPTEYALFGKVPQRKGIVLLARWAEGGSHLPTEQQLTVILEARRKLCRPGAWSGLGAGVGFAVWLISVIALRLVGYPVVSILGPTVPLILLACAVVISAVLSLVLAMGKNAALYRSVGNDLLWTL